MPTYFFHFFDGNSRSEDDMGLELASAEAAYLEAFAAARAMWAELLADRRDPTRCAFEIADETGAILYRVGFSEVLESCRQSGPAKLPASPVLVAGLETTLRRIHGVNAELRNAFVEVRKSLDESRMLLSRLQALELRVPNGL
jgi:hypothetical protein